MNQSTFKSPLCSVLIVSLNSLDYGTPHAPPIWRSVGSRLPYLEHPRARNCRSWDFESRACYCVEEGITELGGPAGKACM